MRLALDTNAYTRLAAGDMRLGLLVSTMPRIHLPVIVLAELKAGFSAGNRTQENLQALGDFLHLSRVEIVPISEETTDHYAALYATLRRQGTPIPLNDLWIAALCLQHDLTLCTLDDHFRHVPALKRC